MLELGDTELEILGLILELGLTLDEMLDEILGDAERDILGETLSLGETERDILGDILGDILLLGDVDTRQSSGKVGVFKKVTGTVNVIVSFISSIFITLNIAFKSLIICTSVVRYKHTLAGTIKSNGLESCVFCV